MSWRVRRIDPFWIKSPAPRAVAAAAAAGIVAGGVWGAPALFFPSGAVFALAVLAATAPAVTATFAVVGVLGGLIAFFTGHEALSFVARLAWALGFGLLYAVGLDAVSLLAATVFNALSAAGLRGPGLALEEEKRPPEVVTVS